MSATETIHAEAVEGLRTEIRGRVLQPGDEGYDNARAVWNGRIDKHPRIIVQCSGTADVIEALTFARERELELSVKGGGHHFSGSAVCDDGLVIDLGPMDAVRVDPDAKRARVQGGATWGDFYHETQPFGLAPSGGLHTGTGVAGVTLGGGKGYLARKHGLSVDNLIGADVVTAQRELVHVSHDEHADLFWALRGGGGNFGVVTDFYFDLHDVGSEVYAGVIYYPHEDLVETLRSYREYITDAPDEVTCYASVVPGPEIPQFPDGYRGEPVVAFLLCYTGPIEDGAAEVEPLSEFGDPIAEWVRPMPYKQLVERYDVPDDCRWYTKSRYLAELPDEAIETIATHTSSLPTPDLEVTIEPMGGAIGRVDATETAFPHRDAPYSFSIWPGWRDPDRDDEVIEWTRSLHEAMEPHAADGVYLNYTDADDSDRIDESYRENYARLTQVKREWDPDNLFRTNQAIKPAD